MSNDTFGRSAELVAYGVRKGAKVRIVISMDDETFAAVRARAIKSGTSFAEQARLLIEWGLETE